MPGAGAAHTKGPAGPTTLALSPALADTALALPWSSVWPPREAGARTLGLGSPAGPMDLGKKGSG